jgi:hypothetical protein
VEKTATLPIAANPSSADDSHDDKLPRVIGWSAARFCAPSQQAPRLEGE